MPKGKLILICQSGGEFVTNNDGSLSYTGGEANALDINNETSFDDLKLKLAEMCNLDYKSVSMKYFLPGNKRTLITLANDKDLKRMYDFHENSVTADVYLTGTKGFSHPALPARASRARGIKVAETVTANEASEGLIPVTVGLTTTPINATGSFSVSTRDSVKAVKSKTRSSTRIAASSTRSPATITSKLSASGFSPAYHVDVTADERASAIDDMYATPADTVKKRRRTASWKFGANGPTILSVAADSDGEGRKSTPQKKNSRNRHNVAVSDDDDDSDDDEEEEDDDIDDDDDDDEDYHGGDVYTQYDSGTLHSVPLLDHSSSPTGANSKDGSVGKMVSSWKHGITGVGQEFENVAEFRDKLQKYAIANRFMYKFKKNDTNRASAICLVEDCCWKIHASWVPSDQVFRIKKMNRSHTCNGESWKAAHPNKNWLVSIIKERLRESPNHKRKQIANGIFKDFGMKLSYTQVWRGIKAARVQLQGSYKEAYNRLPQLCNKILEANPGSYTKLLIGDGKKFQCLFVSFDATVQGFQNGCRPLLFLDSSALKSKYHETLLMATALDADDGPFPVAFAIVDIENEYNWRWFLEQLKSAISTSRSITFVSDREKGLMKVVLELFENAYHGYSLYHLLEDFRSNLRGPLLGDGKSSLPGWLLAAAQAPRLDVFRLFSEEIKQVSPKAYDWLMQVELEYWTNALFKGEYYSHAVMDFTELYSNWTEEVRESTIIQKIETLGRKMMELMQKRSTDSYGWATKLTPSKEQKLLDETIKARGLRVLFSSDNILEVHDDSVNVVDLEKKECTCLRWKVTGLPCSHAVAVFNRVGRNMYDYCSKYFTVDNYRVTYSESIKPVEPISNYFDEEKDASFEEEKDGLDEEKDASAEEDKDDSAEKEKDASAEEEKDASAEEDKDASAEKEKDASAEEDKDASAEKEKDASAEQDKDTSASVSVLPPNTPRPPVLLKEKLRKRKRELKRIMTCSRCKGEGHNKASCKDPL